MKNRPKSYKKLKTKKEETLMSQFVCICTNDIFLYEKYIKYEKQKYNTLKKVKCFFGVCVGSAPTLSPSKKIFLRTFFFLFFTEQCIKYYEKQKKCNNIYHFYSI